MKKSYEQLRMELWSAVVVAVAQSSNATSPSSMVSWADRAVEEFDERFKAKNNI